MIGKRLGHYKILDQLGAGGMGEVFLAEDSKLERKIALKVLPADVAGDPDRLARFEREAKAVAALNHPNIVHVYSVEVADGIHFITMELVEGESLDHVIPSGGMPLDQFFDLAIPLTDGLSEAHDQGIVHRDLKPANIMVDAKGRPKILDFGLAKLRQPESVSVATEAPTEMMTGPGMVLGTYPYMSPEQAEGKEADSRSDLFSFGIVLYEMATGQRPFRGESPVSLISSILKDDPPPLFELRDDLPEGLGDILSRCLEKRLPDRYQSSAELQHELEELRQAVDSGIAAPASMGTKLPAFLIEEEVEEHDVPVFVGREPELAKLESFLSAALEGQSQIVFITGEAGTGKTALIDAFVRKALDLSEDLVIAIGGCNAHTGVGDPYGPFRRIVSQLAGAVEAQWAAGAISGRQARRLWDVLSLTAETIGCQSPDLVDIFVPGQVLLNNARTAVGRAGWLNQLAELVERKATLPPDVMLQQSTLFSQCTSLFESLAQQRPLLLVLEDLHWSDSGSVNLLFELARGLTGVPVHIVGTYRPSEIALGRGEERHPLETVINELQRQRGDVFVALGQSEGRAFLDDLVDSEPNQLGDDFRSTLFERTQGHALFTTELLRDMQERHVLVQNETGEWVESPDLDWEAVPAKVEGAIAERIARLSEELRELLTVASVEGEDFTAEVLSRVRKGDTRQTVRRLSEELERRHRLVSALGLKRVNSKRLSLYRFRHVLFQRYLYDNLDEAERAYLHEDVGKVLEELYGERVEEIAPQLARHFRETGVLDKTVLYLGMAGQRAVRMSANDAAIGFLEEALGVLEQLPESLERDRQELALLTALCSPLVSTRGFASEDIGRVTSRAAELVSRLGEDPAFLPFMWFLAVFYGNGARYTESIATGERMLELATRHGDELQGAMAHWILGLYTMYAGKLGSALDHVAKTVDFCGSSAQPAMAHLYGLEPGVASLNWHALVSLFLGFPDQARQEIETMLARAQELNHPGTLAFAYSYCGVVLGIIDPKLSKPFVEPCLEISAKGGFVEFLSQGLMVKGLLLAFNGQVEEGLALFLEADRTFQAAGAKLAQGLIRQAEAGLQGMAGRIDKGLEAADRGLSHVDETGELLYGPELWRTKAGLLVAGGAPASEVEDCLNKALSSARIMKAKLFELRAATDLAQVWKDEGRTEEAHQLLAPVYGWFTEGFDIPDLQKAEALLEELT